MFAENSQLNRKIVKVVNVVYSSFKILCGFCYTYNQVDDDLSAIKN